MDGYKNAYFDANLAKLCAEMVDAVCPECESNKVIPVIFGLIERKPYALNEKGEWDFCNDDKMIGYLEENGLIWNPGCVPDSFMNDKNEIPQKYCEICKLYFDYR